MDKQTSDERLLKLIEGESGLKRPGVITPGVRKAPGNPLAVRFNLQGLKAGFKGLKVSLFILNRGLIGIAALLTLIFLYVFLSGATPAKSNSVVFAPGDTSAIKKLISPNDGQELTRRRISVQDIKRDFFLPIGTKSEAGAQEDNLDLTAEMKYLKLVGIIWSQNPEVMIESVKDNRTYTFKKGEVLNGQFKVKDISRNAAILEVNTESGLREYVLR